MKATIDFEQEARARVERLREGSAAGNEGTPPPPLTRSPSPCTGEALTGVSVEQGAERLQMPPALIPRHMSREAWKNMERAAARGLMPDETVTPNRRMLYFTMVGLYAAVAAGVMPHGVAKAEKRMAIEAYNRISADAELFRSAGDFYKKVEQATTAYAKRACFDNAEAMYKAVLRAMPKKEHREEDWNDRRAEDVPQNDGASAE